MVDRIKQGKDKLLLIKAVGAGGDPAHPLGTFLNLDPQDSIYEPEPDACFNSSSPTVATER